MIKSLGLVEVIRKSLLPFESLIPLAFIYGSVARAEEQTSSDIDLLIVGKVGLADLSAGLKTAEEELSRPINVKIYSRAEFKQKLLTKNHFVSALTQTPKIFIFGDQNEFEKMAL
jgi:predicted nucleotidyltransferase